MCFEIKLFGKFCKRIKCDNVGVKCTSGLKNKMNCLQQILYIVRKQKISWKRIILGSPMMFAAAYD